MVSLAAEIFLKDFRFAASVKDKDKAEGLPQSVHISKSKKWEGGSYNYDLYSVGTIILSWYVGSGKSKLQGKSRE